MSDYYETMRALLDWKDANRTRPQLELHHLPLALAYLCANCDAISLGPVCPACGSDRLFPLARALGRVAP